VTLIVGIICKDGIVVASDSQTTWGSGKSWNADKMAELVHPYGKAVVAGSGAVITSSNIIKHLTQLAIDRTIFDQMELPGIAANAVRAVRNELRKQQFDCTSEEFQSFIEQEELDCELMIAHYTNTTPRLDTISLSIGLPNRANHFFEAVGSGSDLATYLLTDLCSPNMESTTASVIAVHVVEIVKRHDPYCGGPTKVGILTRPLNAATVSMIKPPESWKFFEGFGQFYAPPVFLPKQKIEELVKMVLEVEIETKRQRGAIILKALKENADKMLKEIMEEFG
jgi:20S proteasome alpha/beta subunit